MNIMARITYIIALALLSLSVSAQTDLFYGFQHPQDTARTKVWWFFGEGATTREGITADLTAFKEQGVGGVVYYDQVHGTGEGADKVFDAHWWQSLIFSSQEAKRLGLSFEANIGNGYVAGGRWITPDRSMQRLAVSEQVVTSTGRTLTFRMGLPRRPHDWHAEVAVLAVPYTKELLADSKLLGVQPTGSADAVQTFDFGQPFTARSITYDATPQGKARTSSMQVPPFSPRVGEMKKGVSTEWSFFGCGFRELPDVGVLEVSDDGVNYRKVCDLHPKYQNLGGVSQQTVAFPTVTGRYFRVTVTTTEKVKIDHVVLSARACVDEWEEKASLVSEFIEADRTPLYNNVEMVQASDIVDLTGKMAADGTVTWPDAPRGQWLVMRFVSVSTGAHTKHGRAEALGMECDKLSTEGARQHWQSYTKPVIDSIRAHHGALQGICMDSHEAGPQNWTQTMEQEFRRLRGYDIRKYLPTIGAGMLVSEPDADNRSALVLRDLRRTISDLITTEYYGEFARLCHEEGLTLTAQAIGGALCLAGDAIGVKRLVDKPQGEFWGYQTEGNYDIKECSSAAHVYGKQIASGEAFTDITYKHSLADIKNLADYAYAFGINEFVVCAVAYQPALSLTGEDGYLNTANGRQYCLNRMNTLWPMSRPFWDYQARCSWLLRQGKPVVDIGLYLGDDVPCRIIANQLPAIPQGYDFDAFGSDVLRHYESEGSPYKLILHADDTAVAEKLKAIGLQPDVEAPNAEGLYFCHRRTAAEEIYFLNNHSDTPMSDRFLFRVQATEAELWDPVTGERYNLESEREGNRTAVLLELAPRQSVFVVMRNPPSRPTPSRPTPLPLPVREGSSHHLTAESGVEPTQVYTLPSLTGGVRGWVCRFSPSMGGPSDPVRFDKLTDWSRHNDPQIRYYSGTAVYENAFSIKKKEKGHCYRLRFKKLAGVAEVYINGKKAGTVWCSPYEVDVTKQIRRGMNRVEIRVTNNLWNRLVGDAQQPEDDCLIRQSHLLAKPSDKLIPAGIIGDIEIVY